MDVKKILDYLQNLIPQLEVVQHKGYYILPTICHNLDFEHSQKKLYLYENEDSEMPLFHCYTECSETFNIYQLIQKYFKLRGETLTYKEAYKKIHGKDYQNSENIDTREKDFDCKKEFKDPLKITLPEYNEKCLDMFEINYTDPWAIEGIDIEILKKFKVFYSKSYQGVFIPHYDWKGRFIGLRVRTYDPLKVFNYKYMPANIGNLSYRHPLSLNFYGLFQNQTNIKKEKKAIIYEAESSALSIFPFISGVA